MNIGWKYKRVGWDFPPLVMNFKYPLTVDKSTLRDKGINDD